MSRAALPDSAPLLDRREALLERWDRDGVLYFSQVLDQAAVTAVRGAYMDQLKALGLVAEGEDQPIWTGLDRIESRHARPIADRVWQDFVGHPSFDGVVRTLLGGPPAWVPILAHRTTPPLGIADDDAYKSRHQDGVFNFGIPFVTCWVPLTDIDEAVGGLAVVPGAHRQNFHGFSDGEIPTYASPIRPGTIDDDRWVRPDYRAGDLLMFHGMTPHAGLANTSDRFRLSLDVRFIPGSGPAPAVGEVDHFDGARLELRVASDALQRFEVDADTMVRGPKGLRVVGEAVDAVLFPGARVIAIPDRAGHARLVRSVSRTFIDLPAAWFDALPPGWVS